MTFAATTSICLTKQLCQFVAGVYFLNSRTFFGQRWRCDLRVNEDTGQLRLTPPTISQIAKRGVQNVTPIEFPKSRAVVQKVSVHYRTWPLAPPLYSARTIAHRSGRSAIRSGISNDNILASQKALSSSGAMIPPR
jgi:hypothetical protein